MNNFKMIIAILLAMTIISCGAKKNTTTSTTSDTKTKTTTVQQRTKTIGLSKKEKKTDASSLIDRPYSEIIKNYIDDYAQAAISEMELYDIPASITLAQGILESGAGIGDLSRKANNHFGIKCKDWKGARVYHDDDKEQECFRKYTDPKFSFRDHSIFLYYAKRYAPLFQLEADDYKSWAKGLKKAGYATDPKYPQKLISLIERYQLDQYDAKVLGKSVSKSKRESGNTVADLESEQYEVKKGDTLYSISRKFGLKVEELKRLNQLTSNSLAIGQMLFVKEAQ
ncbi:glucosaminidase domain-containing protein [Gangjinia marincola]|uniref:Peptidoglycan hydrolase n=1 Tax=Gangjinia marincola TaxID=578463 RepID=A0ABP3XTR4_9FLAO